MDDTLIEAALELFPTPFYLFDERVVHDQIAHVRSLMPENVRLCYAMKASSFALGQASRDAELIEVCSTGEYRICQALGIPDDHVVISGVSKDRDFIDELVEGHPGIARYTAESVLHYDMIEGAATRADTVVPVLVRLTSGNQFGMDRADAMDVIGRMMESDHVRFCGIQFFSGTQKTANDKHRRELRRLDKMVAAVRERFGIDVPELEYGGGLPAEYFEADRDAARRAEDDVIAGLGTLIRGMDFQGPVTLELGRCLVAACGAYATRIVDTKTNKGNNFAVVDGGMHQVVYYGHAMAMQQPQCHLLPEREGGRDELWNICGSLCTTNDILAKQLPLADVKVGDVVVFEKTGAYCMTEGHSLFLSRDLPRVVMAGMDGSLRLVRDRVETYGLNTPLL